VAIHPPAGWNLMLENSHAMIGRIPPIGSLPGKVWRRFVRIALYPAILLTEVYSQFKRKIQFGRLQERYRTFAWFKEKEVPPTRKRILAVIAHYSKEVTGHTVSKVEKLSGTIRGLMSSLGHHDLVIRIAVMPKFHVVESLPTSLRDSVAICECPGIEPIRLPWEAYRIFEENQNDYEYFVFSEDDNVLGDSLILEKCAAVEASTSQAGVACLLMPNRFELAKGRKYYVDMHYFSQLTSCQIDGVKFQECANPHAGFFLLSKSQLMRVLEPGSTFRGKQVFFGHLESAATGLLMERLVLLKPAAPDLHFFEIEHRDNKYTQNIVA
jgi:hypothetical protein